jgi:hypothetical protein
VEHARGVVTIVELPGGRLPQRVEQAVYRFVADSLRQSGGTPGPPLSIAIRRSGRDVIVELEYDRATVVGAWPPAHIADRIAAAGGQLRQADHNGRQQLIALLPCE